MDQVADFIAAMVSGSLLNEATRQWRLTSMKPTDPSDPGGAAKLGFGTYGFGMEGAGPMYGHPGNIPGFSGLALHDPKAGNTVVIFNTVYITPQGGPPQGALFKPIFTQLYPEIAAQVFGGSQPAPTSQTGGSTRPSG